MKEMLEMCIMQFKCYRNWCQEKQLCLADIGDNLASYQKVLVYAPIYCCVYKAIPLAKSYVKL